MATSLMALGVALTAILGGAHTMAVDGTRSLSCCGRATFDLNSEDMKFLATTRKNDKHTTVTDPTGSHHKTSTVSPKKDDGKEKKKGAATRSLEKVLEILQTSGDHREHIGYKDLVNTEMASKRSLLKQQMHEEEEGEEERAMRHGFLDRDSFYSSKSPVPPEPLVGLRQLSESVDGTLEHKPNDQKSVEIALKHKNCNKDKQKLDQTHYLM